MQQTCFAVLEASATCLDVTALSPLTLSRQGFGLERLPNHNSNVCGQGTALTQMQALGGFGKRPDCASPEHRHNGAIQILALCEGMWLRLGRCQLEMQGTESDSVLHQPSVMQLWLAPKLCLSEL